MPSAFDKFSLRQSTRNAIAAMGFTIPTPIQDIAIPLILQGEDVIAQARTGTGKTAAFGIPLAEHVKGRELQALVLVPTRELANQLVDELNRIGRGSSFRAAAVYGGVGFRPQENALRRGSGVTCIVACPGRLLDHLRNGTANLGSVRTLILDEADRMLDMGFIRDIEAILQHLPKERQTLLLSATLAPEIRRLAERYMRHPETVQAEEGSLGTPLTEQFHVEVRGEALGPLLTLLEKERPERAVVFTHTKHTAKRLGAKLKAAGYKAESLQGNMSQSARDRTMEGFRRGHVQILVATDVASRGIDVAQLTHVIQYDMPRTPEDYVHRTGRTGRAGRAGRAFLLAPHDRARDVRIIEQVAGVPVNRYELGPIPAVPQHVAMAGPKARRYESVAAGGGGTDPRRGRSNGQSGASHGRRPAPGQARRQDRGGSGRRW